MKKSMPRKDADIFKAIQAAGKAVEEDVDRQLGAEPKAPKKIAVSKAPEPIATDPGLDTSGLIRKRDRQGAGRVVEEKKAAKNNETALQARSLSMKQAPATGMLIEVKENPDPAQDESDAQELALSSQAPTAASGPQPDASLISVEEEALAGRAPEKAAATPLHIKIEETVNPDPAIPDAPPAVAVLNSPSFSFKPADEVYGPPREIEVNPEKFKNLGPSSKRPESLDEARQQIEETRKEFVRTEHESTEGWQKVNAFFRNLFGKEEQEKNPDIAYWHAHYQNSLINLRELELERVKSAGLSGKELKQEMVEVLTYFNKDEWLNLRHAQLQQANEGKTSLPSVLEVGRRIGNKYNELNKKLPKWLRYSIGGVFLGTGVAATALGAPAVGTAAVAFLAVKRIAAGFGAGVLVETGLGHGAEAAGALGRKLKVGVMVKSLGEEKTLKSLVTNEAIFGLTESRERKMLQDEAWNVTKASAAVAIGVSLGAGALGEWLMKRLENFDFNSDQTKKLAKNMPLKGGETAPRANAAASVEERASDAVPGGKSSLSVPAEERASDAVPGGKVAEAAATVEKKIEIGKALESHTWKSGDSMWMFLDQSLPDTENKHQKIQSILNVIQRNAESIPSSERAEYGLRSGKVELVYAGEKPFQLDKFISQDKLQAILSGQETVPGQAGITSVAAEGGGGTEAPTGRPDRDVIAQLIERLDTDSVSGETDEIQESASAESVSSEQERAPASGALDQAGPTEEERERALELLKTNPYTFPREHPELKEAFFKNLKGHLENIFQTAETRGNPEYDYGKNQALRRTLVADVIESKNTALDESQNKRFGVFLKSAEKVLGPLSHAKAGETLNQYIGRMDATALLVGKKLP